MRSSVTLLALAGAAFAIPVAQLGNPLGIVTGLDPVPIIAGFDPVPIVVGADPIPGLVPSGGGLRRDAVDGVVTGLVKAPIAAVANVPAYVNAAVAAGNVKISNSKITSDIANKNAVNVLSPLKARDLADVEATLTAIAKLFANLLAKAGVNVSALLANVKIQNSYLLTNILNGNTVNVASRELPLVDVVAAIAAAVKALVLACIDAGVNVDAALLNIGIKKSDILDNVLNYNTVNVLSRRDGGLVHVIAVATAIVKALVAACVSAGVNINALIANIDIKDSKILTNILNGNTVNILSRGLPDVSVVTDLVALIVALVNALVTANVNIAAALLNIGIDCSSILTNIANGNTINVLSRDLLSAVVPISAFVSALIQACLGVDANVAAAILNVAIKNSSIGTDILNGNVVNIL